MKEKRPYAEGLRTAKRIKAFLRPYCERIEIAGSIRRRAPMVGDIELVAIPRKRTKPSLFGPVEEELTALDIYLDTHPEMYQQVRSGQRLKELRFEGFQVDLFLTEAARWGVVFTLRTGSAAFSQWLVTSRIDGGARVIGRYVQDCRVWEVGRKEPLDTPEEGDVFETLGVPWVPVEKRDRGYWGEDMRRWSPNNGDCFPKGRYAVVPRNDKREVEHV